MRIFYSKAEGRQNIPAKSPVDETLENTLAIFRNLEDHSGFLGVMLMESFVLQILKRKKGICIELLDSSVPCIDFCEGVDNSLVEELLIAAHKGEKVFAIARQKIPIWEHLKMA